MSDDTPEGIGPARGGFVGGPEPHPWDLDTRYAPGREITFLPDGWLRFPHPRFPWHAVDVLADRSDPERPRVLGLRVEPYLDSGKPLPQTPEITEGDLRGLVTWLAEVARAGSVEVKRRPRGGTPGHEAEVRAVLAAAEASGETPARALMRRFGISRPTAYEWIRKAGEK